MKNLFLTVIRRGGFDLSALLERIDAYHIEGKLTDDDRESLITEARGDAKPKVDASEEVQLLWQAVRDLAVRLNALEQNGTGDSGNDDDSIPAYVQPTGAHDAYFAGDLVVYNGVVYKCAAPDGAACVWSPDVMPGYWQEVADA